MFVYMRGGDASYIPNITLIFAECIEDKYRFLTFATFGLHQQVCITRLFMIFSNGR